MEKRVLVNPLQQVTVEDFNNFGLFPQHSFDHLLTDIGPGASFAGFNVSETGTAEVTVGAGRLYSLDGRVFFNDQEGGAELSLLTQLPVVTRKYVTIAVWGTEIDTETEPRSFLTDAVSRATVSRVVSTEKRRHANISAVAGLEAPDPIPPAVAANYLAVSHVLLDTTGIVSITSVEANRVLSIAKISQRLNDTDAWRALAGAQIETLRTDVAALAKRINGAAPITYVNRVAADLARLKDVVRLPMGGVAALSDTYLSWGSDHFLIPDKSDTGHVDFLAKVEEGCRFPNAAEHSAQLGLLNPLDPNVVNQSNFILPAYTEVPRIEVLGRDSEISISQYQHQTISWEKMTRTRTRIRWGTPFVVCSNGVWWWAPAGFDWQMQNPGGWAGTSGMSPNSDLIYDPIRNILTRPGTGETFQILDVMDNPGHTIVRLVQFWVDEIVDSYYWNQIVTIEGRSGSIVAQTFLNSQGGWLTSVELFLTRVAVSGDLHLMITETKDGAPNYKRVIASATKPVIDLNIEPQSTKITLSPTYLAKGERYAVVVQTPGNHYSAVVEDNKFAQGSLFESTDNIWALGNLTRDLAMRLNFARFDVARVAVQLLPLELSGGIAAIDLNFDSTRPPGTQIAFEVQVAGIWKEMAYYASNPLLGLPPLLPFRVILTGTTDEMPGIGVASNSRSLTSRPRSDFRHISTARTPPLSVVQVHIEFRLEGWRGAPYHVFTPRLLTNASYASVRTPSIITDVVAPDDANALIRTCTWVLADLGGVAVTSYKVRMEGTTDNVLALYHVAERIDVANNT